MGRDVERAESEEDLEKKRKEEEEELKAAKKRQVNKNHWDNHEWCQQNQTFANKQTTESQEEKVSPQMKYKVQQ